jgi:MFS family permease
MGRVNSVYLLASVGGAAIGSGLGGVLAQHFGLAAPFAIAFAGMVLMTAVAWQPLRNVSVRRVPAAD